VYDLLEYYDEGVYFTVRLMMMMISLTLIL